MTECAGYERLLGQSKHKVLRPRKDTKSAWMLSILLNNVLNEVLTPLALTALALAMRRKSEFKLRVW